MTKGIIRVIAPESDAASCRRRPDATACRRDTGFPGTLERTAAADALHPPDSDTTPSVCSSSVSSVDSLLPSVSCDFSNFDLFVKGAILHLIPKIYERGAYDEYPNAADTEKYMFYSKIDIIK